MIANQRSLEAEFQWKFQRLIATQHQLRYKINKRKEVRCMSPGLCVRMLLPDMYCMG